MLNQVQLAGVGSQKQLKPFLWLFCQSPTHKLTSLLEPISGSMQKPMEGVSAEPFFGLYIVPLYKGAIEKNRTSAQRL